MGTTHWVELLNCTVYEAAQYAYHRFISCTQRVSILLGVHSRSQPTIRRNSETSTLLSPSRHRFRTIPTRVISKLKSKFPSSSVDTHPQLHSPTDDNKITIPSYTMNPTELTDNIVFSSSRSSLNDRELYRNPLNNTFAMPWSTSSFSSRACGSNAKVVSLSPCSINPMKSEVLWT